MLDAAGRVLGPCHTRGSPRGIGGKCGAMSRGEGGPIYSPPGAAGPWGCACSTGGGPGRGEGAERGTGEPQNFVSLSDRRLAWKG